MARNINADLKPYTIWADGSNNTAVITRVDERLVEYGYATQESVYYLDHSNFLRNFVLVTEPRPLTISARRALMTQLEATLISLKEKGLSDHVYAIMEEMGL